MFVDQAFALALPGCESAVGSGGHREAGSATMCRACVLSVANPRMPGKRRASISIVPVSCRVAHKQLLRTIAVP